MHSESRQICSFLPRNTNSSRRQTWQLWRSLAGQASVTGAERGRRTAQSGLAAAAGAVPGQTPRERDITWERAESGAQSSAHMAGAAGVRKQLQQAMRPELGTTDGAAAEAQQATGVWPRQATDAAWHRPVIRRPARGIGGSRWTPDRERYKACVPPRADKSFAGLTIQRLEARLETPAP